jgi:hypothetical protein
MGSQRHEELLELVDGTPITLTEAPRVCLAGEIRRATFETPNRAQISEISRVYRGATRASIELRDLTCTFIAANSPAATHATGQRRHHTDLARRRVAQLTRHPTGGPPGRAPATEPP